jgi:predicted O-methyltransferase YrrM
MYVRLGRRYTFGVSHNQEPGDLLELGAYLGKTAIRMGTYLRDGEKFTVCDLFDLAREEKSIRPGARRAYADLAQAGFERNYLSFHETLPTIVCAKTSAIVDHVVPASCRFIHIDASHTYEDVKTDLGSARTLLKPDGIVVLDDYRTEHTTGTAAAIWQAVANDWLRIICLSANRCFATWAPDTAEIQDRMIRWLNRRGDHYCDVQLVLGQRLVRVVTEVSQALPARSPQSRRNWGVR